MYSNTGVNISFPASEALFVDREVYDWRMLDEYAVAGFWTGHYQASKDACKKLLEIAPENERGRILSNLKFAEDKLVS
jgi:hypothetical protein